MSGYLTRLAQRALNQASAVHANARLPFVEAPEPLPDAQPARIGEIDTTRARLAGDPPVPPKREERLDAPRSARTAPPPSEAMPEPRRERASRSEPAPQAEGGHDDAAVSDRPATREADDRPRVLITMRAAEPNAAPPDSRPIAPRPRPTPAMPRIPALAAAMPGKHETGARVPTIEAPQPDVHIHIGRVELTAVPEPAAPRRLAKPVKKPMSLDEYLQRRGGRPA